VGPLRLTHLACYTPPTSWTDSSGLNDGGYGTGGSTSASLTNPSLLNPAVTSTRFASTSYSLTDPGPALGGNAYVSYHLLGQAPDIVNGLHSPLLAGTSSTHPIDAMVNIDSLRTYERQINNALGSAAGYLAAGRTQDYDAQIRRVARMADGYYEALNAVTAQGARMMDSAGFMSMTQDMFAAYGVGPGSDWSEAAQQLNAMGITETVITESDGTVVTVITGRR
jgi:hypothetical protein